MEYLAEVNADAGFSGVASAKEIGRRHALSGVV
jgi:hypothetical protein